MIGSQDTWVQMPTVDLYDTQMMLAAVQAAKDMYNRSEERIKEFNEKYGDFTTPIIADQDWYNREMLGKVYGTINDIYAQGGDPLRNSQDRLRMSMMLNKLPYGEYARKKLRSENAKEWFKNMAILNSKGKYDKDFSEFLGENPNQWALNDPGTTSPTEFQTLKEATNEWYNNRTPRSATAEEKQRLGLDPNYDYTLFTDVDLMNIARDQTPGWNNSAISKYYRNLAEKQVASRGVPYTQEDIERQLQRNIASAQQEWKVDPIKGDVDQFALERFRTDENIRQHKSNAATDYYYKHKDDPSPTDTEGGYSLLKDFYVTTLAKGAGLEYLPQGGIDVNQLPQLLRAAEKRQKAAINSGNDVLTATGQFISPDKINGIIPSSGVSGRGHFLSPEAIRMLRTEDAVRTSFKGWTQKGNPANSNAVKSFRNRKSKQIADELLSKNGDKGYYVKVVPTVDKNGNNTYNMIGDDNKWHTYARLKVYLSNGTNTRDNVTLANKEESSGSKFTEVKMQKNGIELLLPIGLQSNEGKASPDLSISEREKVGIRPYNTVKKWVGEDQDADFPWGTNLIKNETSLQK